MLHWTNQKVNVPDLTLISFWTIHIFNCVHLCFSLGLRGWTKQLVLGTSSQWILCFSISSFHCQIFTTVWDWGSYVGKDVFVGLLGCNAVWTWRQKSVCQKNIFNPEDWGSMFLQKHWFHLQVHAALTLSQYRWTLPSLYKILIV
jgi:hypothetical protein